MRILYWTPYFLPDIGGVEVLSGRLIPELAARGHEFLVIASYGDQGREMVSEFTGVTVRRMNFEATLYQKDIKRMTGILRDVAALKQAFRPDIIHLNTYGAGAFFHERTRAQWPAPELFVVHSLLGNESNSVLGRSLRAADQVVAVSQAMFEGACQLVPEVRAKATVILNGLPMPDIAPTPLGFDPPRLLAFGRVVSDKGFDLALRAFAQALPGI
ncbi:MAG: glycosyltransferase family 4 protein, partial [Caldilineales bacterium]|nr:glycosyltransferase family 4 protein [Caldilineales bacterium]